MLRNLQIVQVCGYPRSGNVWLSRLLGDALDARVQGMPGWERGSLASEGETRRGNYRIIQAHKPVSDWRGKFRQVEIERRKLVVIVRHPFDVVVSASFFWELSIDETIRKMSIGNFPFDDFPSWQDWHKLYPPIADIVVKYRELYEDAVTELHKILTVIGVNVSDDKITKTVFNQSIEVKRQAIAANPNLYSFNLQEQMHHLRKGIAGDWRNHFTENQKQTAFNIFGEVMETLGYGI